MDVIQLITVLGYTLTVFSLGICLGRYNRVEEISSPYSDCRVGHQMLINERLMAVSRKKITTSRQKWYYK